MSLPYLNSYTPPPPPPPLPSNPHLETPPHLYDLNFLGDPTPKPLHTDKISLYPFIPSLYARQYFAELQALGREKARELFKWMPYVFEAVEGLDGLLKNVEMSARSLPGTILYAIFDLTRIDSPSNLPAYPGQFPLPEGHPPLESFVGVIALLETSRANLVTEIGHVLILPKAQRTHVSSHAIALLSHYSLDHPYMYEWSSEEKKFAPPKKEDYPDCNLDDFGPIFPPTSATHDAGNNKSTKAPARALGMRRLQWQANHLNYPSRQSALRIGFQEEGVVRYQRIPVGFKDDFGRKGDGRDVLPEEGDQSDARISMGGGSRSSWVGAITWRDWEEGGVREKMDALVAR